MSRFKKILRYLLLLLLILVVVLFFVGNAILNSASQKAMRVLARRGKTHGLEINEPRFESARLSGFRSASCTDVQTELRFPKSKTLDPRRLFDVRVDRMEAWLTGRSEVTIAAHGIAIDSNDVPPEEGDNALAESDSTGESVAVDTLQVCLDLALLDPIPGLESALPELVSLAVSGSTRLALETKGVIEFSLKSKPAVVHFHTLPGPRGTHLVLNPEDLRPLSERFQEELTDAEIELISEVPLRTARLLRIKDDAESTAQRAFDQDDQVPQDAYRHVLWSFLLTKAYGTDFARRLTDAHEEGDTGNTPAEREMDYHNNAVGRRYFKQKVARKAILARVQSESDVIREPR